MQNILNLFRHIFGQNFATGINWFTYLLKEPNEKLPVILLTSTYTGTGKSTFLHFLRLALPDTSVIVHTTDIMANYNAHWCDKQLILVKEADLSRQYFIEKIKHLATSKELIRNEQGKTPVNIDFTGAMVLATNNARELRPMPVLTFMHNIWVIDVPPVSRRDFKPDLLELMESELPEFLKYIESNAEELCIGHPKPQS